MLYVSLCLVYPKAWVGFDWDPATVRLSPTGIRAINAEGGNLWEWTSPCRSVDTSRSMWVVADIDGDGESEVGLLSASAEGVPCSSPAALYVFNRDGELRFSGSAAVPGEYPEDSTKEQRFSNLAIEAVRTTSGMRIVTQAAKSFPARTHYQLWTHPGFERAGSSKPDSWGYRQTWRSSRI